MISIRAVTAQDCQQLFVWANDPVVRQMARSTDPIPWDGHQRWFSRRLSSPDCRIFLAEAGDGTPLGQVRLDREGWQAEVDISVDPAQRGRGIGGLLLAHAARQAQGWAATLVSAVKQENAPSQHLFLLSGYQDCGLSDGYYHYRLDIPVYRDRLVVDGAALLDFAARRGLTVTGSVPDGLCIRGAQPLDRAGADDIAFCRFDGEVGLRYITACKAGVMIVPRAMAEVLPQDRGTLYLLADAPRLEILHFLIRFWHEAAWDADPRANPCIHPQARIGANVRIGPFTVIGPDVEIADNVRIGSNCHLEHCSIGRDTILANNIAVGGTGFGYETDDATGEVLSFPHVGRVVIGERVEIGSSTCLDRGSIGDTIVGDDCKIDNLIHIAHNVRMGKRCKVIALAIIGGSCVIGDDAWIAPASAIRDWRSVGAGAVVGLGAVVTKDVAAGETVFGNPARSREKTEHRYK